MDVAHKVEYKLRDLPTRAVTLFPDQALVQRDVKGIPLKPGVNEICIVGLTPTTNKDSVKVEGNGDATIIGITTERSDNRELFEDVYPDDESEDSDSDSDSDESDEEPEQPQLLEVKMRLVQLRDDLLRAQEVIANGYERISILDSYCRSLGTRDHVDLQKVLNAYKQEREKAHADRMVGLAEERNLHTAIDKASKEHTRLLTMEKKLKGKTSKNKARVQKMKKKQKDQRFKRRTEAFNAKWKRRVEREQLWPKYVYTVTVQLEVNASFTPTSSRRGSISSNVDLPLRPPSRTMDIDEPTLCDLVLSYITDSAYWTPNYDLQLLTPSSTGSLCFDACLNNTTSEKWENCKITLSTSQAAFSGSNDPVPVLRPWKIKTASKDSDTNGITESMQELKERVITRLNQPKCTSQPRSAMFGRQDMMQPPMVNVNGSMEGVGRSDFAAQDYQIQLMLLEQQNKKRFMMARQEEGSNNHFHPAQQQVQQHMMQQQQQHMMRQQQQQRMQPQHLPQPTQRMGMALQAQQATQQAAQQMAQLQMAQGQMLPPPVPLNAQPDPQSSGFAAAMGGSTLEFGTQGDESWSPDAQPSLDFQQSLIDETGFTTTYDLPGFKTLLPKFTATKQRVARVNFASVYFGHTIVAKYHAAAYLKTRLRNISKWTLLKGPSTLTLDGSFMGKVTIPRCSSGDTFGLSLGVDPSIKVLYPKADVKRSTTGMFSKEDSSQYTRSILIHHTRSTANKPANVIVLDQVPVSEDERLRVDLVAPQGLTIDGPRVSTGLPGRETAVGKDWGKANVGLKQNGALYWEVSLNPGKCVKLPLEYSVSLPTGENAQECTKS